MVDQKCYKNNLEKQVRKNICEEKVSSISYVVKYLPTDIYNKIDAYNTSEV